MGSLSPEAEARVRDRLRQDTRWYAERFAYIVDKAGALVRFSPHPAQLKLWEALEAQRTQGLPERVIILKARQMGFSTAVQIRGFQRASQLANHEFMTVAHEREAGGRLLRMSETLHRNMPADPRLAIKPRIRNSRRDNEILFGEPSKVQRELGDPGLNSTIRVDTANELQGGRSFTIHTLHASEVAHWPDINAKLTTLLNAVPDLAGTFVALESTAKGYNEFKDRWDDAVAGRSEYAAVFAGWWEDPTYTRPFLDERHREEFAETIGDGEYGEQEPFLLESLGLTLEQLHWRRWAIVNKAGGRLDMFNQEYPATPQDAFLATGRTVFAMGHIQRVVHECEQTQKQAVHGRFVATGFATRAFKGGSVEIPTGVEWVPSGKPVKADGEGWLVWEHPREGGQYVVAADPSGGIDDDSGERAFHAIQVLDHDRKTQVAEYRSRIDPDQLTVEIFLVALRYTVDKNRPWVVVEATGSYGAPMNRRLYNDFQYGGKLYLRQPMESTRVWRDEDRLGWSTDRGTKGFLHDVMHEALREDTHGIRSLGLALEMTTYIEYRGKAKPEKGKFADRLMAYLIGMYVAGEKRPKRLRDRSSVTVGARPVYDVYAR